MILAVACHSPKAKEFNTLIDSADRKAFVILVADSSEDVRLQALINRKAVTAIKVATDQANQLKSLITEIESFPVTEISDAKRLKQSTAAYYKLLLQLKNLDIREAQLMAGTLDQNSGEAKKAQDDMSALRNERVKTYKLVNQSEQEKYKAKLAFQKNNHLQ